MSHVTEGLIEIIDLYYRGVYKNISHVYLEAIIDKLRAADALCEAAKDADHLLMQNNYDSEEGTRKVLRKAIAEYAK